MTHEKRDIKLGLSSFFDWSVWRSNESRTEKALSIIQKEQKRFQSEYKNVTTAFDNIIAFLQSALPEKRLVCLKSYRKIFETNPKNPNALIDLIIANIASNSEKQKHIFAFTEALTDGDRRYNIGKACLELGLALEQLDQTVDFEQMYSQMDRNMPFRQKYRTFLKCVEEIDPKLVQHLHFEHFESENELELLGSDTYSTLFTWTPMSIIRDTKKGAVLYLSEGLKRIGEHLPQDELLIWKYFLANAYRLLVNRSHQTGFEMHLHKKWRMKAIQLFYEVIRGTDLMINEHKKEILETNKARSYANIGEIVYTLPQKEDRSYYLSCIPEVDFCEMLENSALPAFETARSIRPDDITVLVRYGKFLLHYRPDVQRDPEQEQNDLDKALDMFSDAIKQDEGYWLAHALRMTAYKRKYQLEGAKRSNNSITLLENAEKDGEFCFSNPTTSCLLEYGRVLHWLAEPLKGKGDGQINHDHLQKAIDVLSTVDAKFQHHNSQWVYKERANCHFVKKEIEDALLYIELAFYANEGATISVNFIQLCNYFIEAIELRRMEESACAFAFRRLKTAVATLLQSYRVQFENLKSSLPDMDDTEMKIMEQYLEEFQENRCSAMMEKYTDDQQDSIKRFVNDVLYYHSKDTYLNSMIEKIKEKIAEEPNVHELLNANQTLVISGLICKALETVSGRTDSLSNCIRQHTSIWTSTLDVEEIFFSPETVIPSPRKNQQPYNQAGKRYDFFVLHADADNDWVVCCLLQQLEYGQYGFTGCVPERDFETGKKMLENIKDKINDSNKILIVISRNTPEAFFEYLEKFQILKCLGVTSNTYVLNVGVEVRPKQLLTFPFINCSPLPLDLNEVRDVLALPPPTKCQERPLVYIQPTSGTEQDQPINILSAKCTVDEDRKITASNILELGIPQVPIDETVSQLESAETIFEYGFPMSDILILYERHVVNYDTQKRLAKWVAYKLSKDDLEGAGNRDECKFTGEMRLTSELQPSSGAYKVSNITRGHMCPAADSKVSKDAMHDSFKYTNIYPEYINNKMWCAVEVYIREKVLKDFQEVRIYVVPAFKPRDSDRIVTYPTVGATRAAVPTHMFKFVIAIPESRDGTLVTGSFMICNEERFGCEEMESGDEPFKYFLDKKVKTDIKTITTVTGIQFDKMLYTKGHKYNEDLLKECSFISAEEFKRYEEQRIKKKIAGKLKKETSKGNRGKTGVLLYERRSTV